MFSILAHFQIGSPKNVAFNSQIFCSCLDKTVHQVTGAPTATDGCVSRFSVGLYIFLASNIPKLSTFHVVLLFPRLRRPNWASIPRRSPRHLLADFVKIIQKNPFTIFLRNTLVTKNDSVSHFPMVWPTNRRRRFNCRWRWQMSRMNEFFFFNFFAVLCGRHTFRKQEGAKGFTIGVY